MQQYDVTSLGNYDRGPCKLEFGISVLGGQPVFYLTRRKEKSWKQKTVWFSFAEFPELLVGLVNAACMLPSRTHRVPLGSIQCPMGDIFLEIGPYWYGRDSAVFLRQNRQGVAIEHDHIAGVFGWLCERLVSFAKEQVARKYCDR